MHAKPSKYQSVTPKKHSNSNTNITLVFRGKKNPNTSIYCQQTHQCLCWLIQEPAVQLIVICSLCILATVSMILKQNPWMLGRVDNLACLTLVGLKRILESVYSITITTISTFQFFEMKLFVSLRAPK